MTKIRVTTTLTIVHDVPFDVEHYGDATMSEALVFERDREPDAVLDYVNHYLETGAPYDVHTHAEVIYE